MRIRFVAFGPLSLLLASAFPLDLASAQDAPSSEPAIDGSVADTTESVADTSVPPTSVAPATSPSESGAPLVRRTLRFRVLADDPGTTLYVGSNQRLCTAPCTIELEPGYYRLGVENADGDLRIAPGTTPLEVGGFLRVDHESRRVPRIARWVTTSLLYGAAIGLFTAAVVADPLSGCDGYGLDCSYRSPRVFSIPSMITAAGAISMTFVSAFTHDRGRVVFTPMRR